MSANVHGIQLAHPLATLQQSAWFATLSARLAQAGRWFWHECEQAGQRRARNHLYWLADCHEGSNPEFARQLRDAMR
jgi:hypothetical protein